MNDAKGPTSEMRSLNGLIGSPLPLKRPEAISSIGSSQNCGESSDHRTGAFSFGANQLACFL